MKGFKGDFDSRTAVREYWEDEASHALQLNLEAILQEEWEALGVQIDREDPIDRVVWNYCYGNVQ